jgi:hypothetical protein
MKKMRGEKPVGVIIHIHMEISQGNSLYRYITLYMSQTIKNVMFSFFYLLSTSTKSGTGSVGGGGWHQWEGEVVQKGVRG